MTPSELVVVWRVAETCSLSCLFCGYSRELNRSRRTVDEPMALEFGARLAAYGERFGRSILVSFLGGEPLEWRGLRRLSSTFRQQYELRLGVTTNGLPLESREVRADLLANFEQVTISIDGLEQFHDQVRGVPGLFRRVRRSVEQLRQGDRTGQLRLRINSILMRGNIESFGTLCDEVADWGIDELTFNQLGGNERPEFYAANRLCEDQVARFAADLPALRQRMLERHLHILGTERYLQRLACTAAGTQIAVDDCRPGQVFWFIDERGRVSPCSFTSEGYGINISELRSPESLAQLAARFVRLRQQRRLAPCHDCHATHVFDKFTSLERKDSYAFENVSTSLEGAHQSSCKTVNSRV